MNKTLSMVFTAGLALALTACSGGNQVTSTTSPSAATSSADAAGDSARQSGERVWPTTKNVDIICPASAGGLTDSAARIWANYLSQQFPDTNFVVNNDNTGNGTVAMEKIRNSQLDDGSEILFFNTNMLLANYTGTYECSLFEDFNFCTIPYATTPDSFILCTAGDAPYENVQDLVDAMKAAPGTLVTGVSNGSTRQFLAGALKASTGTDFKIVDSGQESDTVTSLLGGNIDFAFIQAGNAVQYAETGDMKLLGICQSERSENFPDVPTFDEQGIDGMNLNSLQIVCGPKDMPDEIAEAIAETMKGYAADPTVQEALANMKVAYPEYVDRQSCLKLLEELNAIFADSAKALGYE